MKQAQTAQNKSGSDAAEFFSELDEAIWSVISFDRIEASSLSYPDASLKIAELDANGVNGLCIVTDAAAGRTLKLSKS
jgi:hypothetical protein